MGATAILAFLAWGVLVGIVFSAIGAAGGLLTSFGLATLFGVLEPNSIKPMTQIIVLVAALTFVPNYFRRSSLVLPLGLLLGAGGLVGAYVGSTFSTFYLSEMRTFRPLFGLLTLAVAAQIVWKLLQSRKAAGAERQTRQVSATAVTGTQMSPRAVRFTYGKMDFKVPVWSPLLAGAIVSLTASIFGVGGGFLLVPYMAVMIGMPMHIVPATAAIAIFISLFVSIVNFLALGAVLHIAILAPLAIGTIVGAVLGPRINKALDNAWLEAVLAVIVAGIGLKYVIAG